MKICSDHICTVDWVVKEFIRLRDLDRFIAIYYISLGAYRKSKGFKNDVSKRKIMIKFIKSGRMFTYCPKCGEKIDYREFL